MHVFHNLCHCIESIRLKEKCQLRICETTSVASPPYTNHTKIWLHAHTRSMEPHKGNTPQRKKKKETAQEYKKFEHCSFVCSNRETVSVFISLYRSDGYPVGCALCYRNFTEKWWRGSKFLFTRYRLRVFVDSEYLSIKDCPTNTKKSLLRYRDFFIVSFGYVRLSRNVKMLFFCERF